MVKLRTRLFLFIGSLFLGFFLLAFFMESFVIKKKLHTSEQKFLQTIETLHQETLDNWKRFLGVSLAEDLGHMHAYLQRLKDNPAKSDTYSSLASIMILHPWIDFVEAIQKGTWMEGINPLDGLMRFAQKQDSQIVFEGKHFAFDQLSDSTQKAVEQKARLLHMHPPQMLVLRKNPVRPRIFYDARKYLKQPKLSLEGLEKKEYLQSFQTHSITHESLLLLYALSLEQKKSPQKQIAVGVIDEDHVRMLFSEDVFYKKRDAWMPTSFHTMLQAKDEKLFFTTCRVFSDQTALCIGKDLESLLSKLSLITQNKAMMVSSKKIYTDDPVLSSIDAKKIPMLLQKDIGTMEVQDTSYVFFHLDPLPSMDVHFYVFVPKTKAYAFLDIVKKQGKALVSSISWSTRVIALVALIMSLILLHFIAKELTRPIQKLAIAAAAVRRGVDQIVLPKSAKTKEVSQLIRAFAQMVKGLREKEKVRSVLNKVVSEEIAREIVKGKVKLGGEERNVTVFFADIRGFTALTEQMPPKEVIALLNTCMDLMTSTIDEHQGVVDKFVGDELMALFGAPVKLQNSHVKAIQAALQIQKKILRWNASRKEHQLPAIQMGIGIDAGVVLAGNMGAKDRLNYTVIGSHVNLASRLCDQARGNQILISHELYQDENVQSTFVLRDLGKQVIKGFSKQMPIYEVLGYKDHD